LSALYPQDARAGSDVGLSITGALTPAGLGISALIPLIKAGFVDWIISDRAQSLSRHPFRYRTQDAPGNASTSDIVLREEEVVRIYDIFFDYSVLLDTDAFFRKIITGEEFQKTMSTAEFHYLAGRYVRERELKLGLKDKSLLGVAYEYGVPIYTSSPGDSSIGMNVGREGTAGKLSWRLIRLLDVNGNSCDRCWRQSATRSARKAASGKGPRVRRRRDFRRASFSAAASPKNFLLQLSHNSRKCWESTNAGHDYFLQVTDAGLTPAGFSGATPGDAVSWGKVDPDRFARTRWFAMSTPQVGASRSLRHMLWLSINREHRSACMISGLSLWHCCSRNMRNRRDVSVYHRTQDDPRTHKPGARKRSCSSYSLCCDRQLLDKERLVRVVTWSNTWRCQLNPQVRLR
jgi:deoxyhypusine synthase